jgi:hypothetical protein
MTRVMLRQNRKEVVMFSNLMICYTVVYIYYIVVYSTTHSIRKLKPKICWVLATFFGHF